MKPDLHIVPEYYRGYINSTEDSSLIKQLDITKNELIEILEMMTEDQAAYRYNLDKWSCREVVLHIMDCERIFAYRALSFARGEVQNLISFDQDKYVINSNAVNRTVPSLLKEYQRLRESTIDLFENFSNEQLLMKGRVAEFEFSVNTLGYILLGHQNHHVRIIKSKYL